MDLVTFILGGHPFNVKFFKTLAKTEEAVWIPEAEWHTVCEQEGLTVPSHPQEQIVGLAYNNQRQVVEVTRNLRPPALSYYVTILEQPNNRSLISRRSFLTVLHERTSTLEFGTFSLLEINVREEGLGERGLMLEALIQDIEKKYTHYAIRGDYATITLQGRVSQSCFTKYGFQLKDSYLTLTNTITS